MFQEELDQQRRLHGVAMSCNVLNVHCTYCTYAACRPVWLAEFVAKTCFKTAPTSHRPANSQAVSKGPLKAVDIWFVDVWCITPGLQSIATHCNLPNQRFSQSIAQAWRKVRNHVNRDEILLYHVVASLAGKACMHPSHGLFHSSLQRAWQWRSRHPMIRTYQNIYPNATGIRDKVVSIANDFTHWPIEHHGFRCMNKWKDALAILFPKTWN